MGNMPTKDAKLLVIGEVPPKLEREFTVVGKRIKRYDGFEKVTGIAKYSGDVHLENKRLLHCKILRSPYPHARITKIDTSKAEKVKGVWTIMHSKNSAFHTAWYNIPQRAFAEEVMFVGDEVAAVAATSVRAAQKALELIDVEYEELPFVLDAEEAMRPNAPKILPGGNVIKKGFWKPKISERGDIEKGFREADVIHEDTYFVQAAFHGTIEPRTCVAWWKDGKLTLWQATQGVHQVRQNMAKAFNLPLNKIRVITQFAGGGFGSKAGAQRYAYYAAKLSMVTGRPVKIENTRADEFFTHPSKPESKVYYKVGVKKDGTLTAIYCKAFVNTGMFNGFVGWQTAGAWGLYKCDNVKREEYFVKTNTNHTGPMRAVHEIQFCFHLESFMDDLSHKLGMDPVEFKRKNYATTDPAHHGKPYSAKHLDQCLDKVAEAIGWEKRNKKPGEGNGIIRRGIGIAQNPYGGVGIPPFKAHCNIEILSDGSADVRAGVNEIGCNQKGYVVQVAAEELGMRYEDMNIIMGDTDATPYAPASHATRVTAEMTPAIIQAAYKARKMLFEFAAPMLKTTSDQLESKLGMIYIKSDPSKKISIKEVAGKTVAKGHQILGTGSRKSNFSAKGVSFHTWSAQAAEIEVNTLTGTIKVLKVAGAHELGKAINPLVCDGQWEGGIAMGLGYTIFEERIIDKATGIMVNPDFHQYKIVTSLDMPEVIPMYVEEEDPYFGYSAKGIGEPTCVATPAAIANAFFNATGIRMKELPMLPEKVLEALSKKAREG